MMIRHHVRSLAAGLALLAPWLARAQEPPAPPTRRALAVGVSASTGIIAVESVHRWTVRGGRLPVGAAFGLGTFGPGARAQIGLRGAQPGGPPQRIAPYLGVGYANALWSRSFSTARDLVALETGVQVWPRTKGQVYADVGLSALTVRYSRGPNHNSVLPRVLVGAVF